MSFRRGMFIATRLAMALIVAGYFLYGHVLVALFVVASPTRSAPYKLGDTLWSMSILVITGVLGVSSARAILGIRSASWWLLLALPVPTLVGVRFLWDWMGA